MKLSSASGFAMSMPKQRSFEGGSKNGARQSPRVYRKHVPNCPTHSPIGSKTVRSRYLPSQMLPVGNGPKPHGASVQLVDVLSKIETSPWSEWPRGKPLTPTGLAGLLRGYGITPHSVRIDGKTPKGYERKDFRDAFLRYLRIVDTPGPQTATTQQTNIDAGSSDFSTRNTTATVAVSEREKLNENGPCGGVAVSGTAAAKSERGIEEDL